MNTPSPNNEVATPSMSSSMPLQLSGFLTGDTIRVQGDTGDLRFSVELNINKKLFPEEVTPLDPLDTIARSPEEFSVRNSGFSSSYVTPIEINSRGCAEEGDLPANSLGEHAMTRLRSGVISPVAYFPRVSLGEVRSSCGGRVRPWKKKNREKTDAFERLLRRRSCPVRPCNSYAFFLMATWGDVNAKSPSFGETSKRLGQIWCKLPCKEKKVYEEMALKDNARYKWQSELFMSKGV